LIDYIVTLFSTLFDQIIFCHVCLSRLKDLTFKIIWCLNYFVFVKSMWQTQYGFSLKEWSCRSFRRKVYLVIELVKVSLYFFMCSFIIFMSVLSTHVKMFGDDNGWYGVDRLCNFWPNRAVLIVVIYKNIVLNKSLKRIEPVKVSVVLVFISSLVLM
jgi:hypothetical protein